MQTRGILEVETPALSQAGNTDPAINSFAVDTYHAMRYLHTSPEYPMKRLLAAGSGDIYQLCKVWRQDESGRRHNPEFSLLEYYRVGFSYQRLMHEVAAVLHHLLPQLQKTPQWRTYRDCFLESFAIDPHLASEAQLAHLAEQQGLDVTGALTHQAWCDLLFSHCIEPQFAPDRLTFVHQYPAAQAALAELQPLEHYWVSQRFEVYLGAMELGNGYQELTAAAANWAKLHSDACQQDQSVPIDWRFLTALQAGMPRSAGVAIGLDRVLLCKLGTDSLARVLSFAWELA